MRSRYCPICGQPCVNELKSDEGTFDLLENRCVRCNGELTSEGLLCRGGPPSSIVQELGKGGEVIWEYRTGQAAVDVDFLVRKILELESRCREGADTSSTPLSLGIARWNLKSAARRLRRWVI